MKRDGDEEWSLKCCKKFGVLCYLHPHSHPPTTRKALIDLFTRYHGKRSQAVVDDELCWISREITYALRDYEAMDKKSQRCSSSKGRRERQGTRKGAKRKSKKIWGSLPEEEGVEEEKEVEGGVGDVVGTVTDPVTVPLTLEGYDDYLYGRAEHTLADDSDALIEATRSCLKNAEADEAGVYTILSGGSGAGTGDGAGAAATATTLGAV